MAKYSKAAGKAVKTAVKKMKKGTLTSGKSDKKVTSKKQAVAIGLSEAREKGAKVPAKKATAPKKKATATKTAAPKKVAAKKASPKKAAAPKKTATGNVAAPKKAAAKKAVASKTAAGKKTAISKVAPKKAGGPKAIPVKKAVSSKSKAKMPGETSDTGEFISNETNPTTDTVTNTDVNDIVTPEAESENAVFAANAPDQQYMPGDFKASTHDAYHGNVNPSKAKTGVKPSGKKPLWDNRK